MTSPESLRRAYEALHQRVTWSERPGRVLVEAAGADRAKSLHNLATQDIKRLAPGRGAETFVTSPQGKTLGYWTVLVADETLILRSDGPAWEHLQPHIAKYAMFDDSTWTDRTADTFELHLAGPDLLPLWNALELRLPPTEDYSHFAVTASDGEVRFVREAPLGVAGVTILGPAATRDAWTERLADVGSRFGIEHLTDEARDALRIAAGTPVFGRDVTPDNLPQEVDRDSRAISFVKGCYLGQETVARIDALGHVNKVLRRVSIHSTDLPPVGSKLEADGKAIGTITSAAADPTSAGVIALAYVRAAHAQPGTKLTLNLEGRTAEVTVLPPPGR